MEKLLELKEMLCDELEKYSDRNELSMTALKEVDTLAHAIKNIDKIIESAEGEYSEDGDWRAMGSYNRGSSYARRSMRSGNSYARRKRDSMGRYSRADGRERMMSELSEMMNEVDGQDREAFQRLMSQLDR